MFWLSPQFSWHLFRPQTLLAPSSSIRRYVIHCHRTRFKVFSESCSLPHTQPLLQVSNPPSGHVKLRPVIQLQSISPSEPGFKLTDVVQIDHIRAVDPQEGV